jgi:anthranilate phosphoribosyltransferase
MPKEAIAECIDEIGIGFLFAPALHPAMKYVIGPRRELGIHTIFNILGPLCNPAGARRQLLGVYDGSLTSAVGAVLQRLGTSGALVVHSDDGLDELSTTGANTITRVTPKILETTSFDPVTIGIRRANLSDLVGGSPEDNAEILRSILKGEQGPRRDVVLLNAAAALVAGGKAAGFAKALNIAAQSLDSGKAYEKLEQLLRFTNNQRAGQV